jgi:EAL domain-containing protein (putative c-di-GMP-specific phosphodiesterase class I)
LATTSKCIRAGDTVSRLGGDEFVIIIRDLSADSVQAASQAEATGKKILATLSAPYQLESSEWISSSSIGITLLNNSNSAADELMKQADIAMYQAKKSGRNNLRFFDPEMQLAIVTRSTIESKLRKALANQEFELYYQIQKNHYGKPIGAEALIRWIQPETGVVSPATFIPLAEETGMIIPIGQWVIESACKQIQSWQKSSTSKNLVLAINVSAKQFRHEGFIGQVKSGIQNHGIDPKLLKLELTESLMLDDIDEIITTMSAIKNMGVGFSLDDFGTGYSSLQYLKRLPIDQLKIDQTFIRDIADDENDRAIVKTIIAMAHSLNLEVIAEGVESEVQRKFLNENGCHHFQGYLLGRPVPIEEFNTSLE